MTVNYYDRETRWAFLPRRVVLSVLLVILCAYVIRFFPNHAFLKWTDAFDSTETIALTSGSVYRQEINHFPDRKVDQFVLRLGSVEMTGSGSMMVEFFEGERVVDRWEVAARSIRRNKPQVLNFHKPVWLSKEKRYVVRFWITSDSTDLFEIWTSRGGHGFFADSEQISDRTAIYQFGYRLFTWRSPMALAITLPIVLFLIFLGVWFDRVKTGRIPLILGILVIGCILRFIATDLFSRICINPNLNETPYLLTLAHDTYIVEPQSTAGIRVEADRMDFASIEFLITRGKSENFEVQLRSVEKNDLYYARSFAQEDFFESSAEEKIRVVMDAKDAYQTENGYFPDIPYFLYITNHDAVKKLELDQLRSVYGDTLLNVSFNRPSNSGYGFAAGFTVLFLFFITACILTFDQAEVSPVRVFLLMAMPLTVLYLFLLTTFTVDDAFFHYSSAYRISNFLSGFDESLEWRGRATDIDYFQMNENPMMINPSIQSYIVEFTNAVVLHPDTDMSGAFPIDENIKSYSPLGHLPQALGLSFGRLLRLNGFFTAQLARLMTAIIALLTVVHLIRIVPVGRYLFMLIALLPRAFFTNSSISYDALVFVSALGFLANLFRLYSEDIRHLSKVRLAETVFWAATLGAVKGGANLVLLPVTLILIRKKDRCSWLLALLVIAASFGSFAVSNPRILAGDHFQMNRNDARYLTASFAYTNLLEFLRMAVRTYWTSGGMLFASIGGARLSWTEPTISNSLILGMYALTALIFILEEDEFRFGVREKMIFIATILMTLIMTAVMLLKDTLTGSVVVSGIQGRYFLPILPLVFLLLPKWKSDWIGGQLTEARNARMITASLKVFAILSGISVYQMARLYLTR